MSVGRLSYLVVCLCGIAWGNLAQAAPKHVLILDSFGRDVVPFNTVATACRTTLALELGEQVDIYSTSLDAAQLGEPDKEVADQELLMAHLARRPVDLIILVGAPAVRFAVGHREALFPSQPMVFTGLDPRNVRPEYLLTNTTMVAQAIDLRGAMEDILQLRPDTTNVVVVLGNSALERFWTAECRRDFAPFTNRVAVSYLNDCRLQEMERIVSTLPPRSFVLYGMLIEDAAGIAYGQEAGLKRIRAAAKAPVYGCFNSQFGAGIIGGRLYQDEAVGREAARVAIRILQGERPEGIPPRLLEKATPRYDWRELNRWGISESVLPASSVVSFRQPGFWEKYWGRTLLVLAFVVVQSVLIGGLLVSRRRQRKLETIASLVAELSTRFVNLPAEQVDREIEQAQRRICECLGVETAGLWQWTSTLPREMILTHLHRPPNGPKAPARISAQEMFPWLLEQALKGKTLVIDTDDIPMTATRDRETRVHYGIKSSVLLPLAVGGQPILGVLTFTTLSAKRTWSKQIVLHLELIAQLFTNALVRKSAEQSLRESELRLSLAADSAGVGLWELDCRTQQFWATDRTLSLFGFSATEVLSLLRWEQAIHPEDREHFRQALDRSMQHGEPINLEYRLRLADGKIKWVASRGRPYFRSPGEPERILGVSTDISERKQAAERWRLTVEAMPNGVILVDQSGRIVLVNAQAEQIFGYARQELLGQGIQVLIPERFREPHSIHQAEFAARPLARPMGAGRHIVGRRRDGSEFPVEVGLNPIRAGEDMLVLCAVVDLSLRRKMEAETLELRRQLAHTGRVSMLGQLASALAHELSQPLGAILRNAEAAEAMLQEPAPDLEELRAIVTDIRQDDQRAGLVIDRLRSLLKRRALELLPVDLPDLIREVVALVHADAVARHIKIEFNADGQLPPVLGDRVHLQQVLLNLIINGMDAMSGTTAGERGVTIRTRRVGPGWVEVGVSDHGGGFSPEAAARLFEPFYTTKPHGMGMGLAVSKTIIEAHGGKLAAENQPGGGAVFRFRIPVAPAGNQP